jgi:WD40 repeat protein
VRAELNGRAMQLDEAETPRHALHAKAITRLVFAGDGSRLLTCSLDGTAQLMRLPHTRHQRANVTAAALSGHDGPLRDCAVSATGRFLSAASKTAGAEPRLLLTCAADRTARVWCEGMANPLMTIRTARSSGAESETNPAFAGEVTAGSFFFRDRFIAAACEGELLLFRFALQPPESPLQGARWTARYAAAFVGRHDDAQSVTAMGCANAGDAPLVLTATSNRALHVWDLNAARVALSLPDAHARPIHCISAASAESAHWGWLTAAVDGSVRLWDARVGATVRRFQGHVNRQQPVRAALSSCGTLVATGSEDKSVYLFDVRSGAQVQRLAGFADVVSDVAFHPTAPSLAAATYDGRVRLFREAAA